MNQKYHFKKAELSDCPVIRQVARQVWGPTYEGILSQEQLDYMFEWMYSVESLENQLKNGHAFFLLYEEEIPVGYFSVNKEHGTRYHLQKIYLNPAKQGLGLGKILLERAEDFVREIKSQNTSVDFILNVNRRNKALQFYKKQGFEIESQGDFDIGNGYFMNDYIMKKIL